MSIGKRGEDMQSAKTLWMLDYRQGGWGQLVPLYAEDEHEAWIEAYSWATQHEIALPQDAILTHFPNGFTVYRRVLPGQVEE